jgi:octaprenyl-diphosphate synthase
MDALATLHAVTEKHSLNGAIAESLAEASTLLGDGLDALERELSAKLSGAPENVAASCRHVLEAGGKRIRPSICLLSFRAAHGRSDAPPVALAAACELLHNATLLHDDVIDEGDVRRGRPAVRVVFGNAVSILSGDYLLMKCVETVAAAGPGHMPVFVDTLRRLVEGEVTQLALRGSLETTREQYFRIVEGKTASLFKFAAFSGALAAGGDEVLCAALGEFGWHVGVAFQMIDDVLDFAAEPQAFGKSVHSDVREGKMTLPLIAAAARSETLRSALARLVAHPDTAETPLARRICEEVRALGAVDEARREAAEHTAMALEALRRVVGGDPAVVRLLCAVAEALQAREA